MVILKVAFTMKRQAPEEKQKKKLAELVEVYKKVPALKQKYFLADPNTGEGGGIYLFEGQEALEQYLKSDLFQRVTQESAKGEPKIEKFAVIATTDAGVLL